MCECGIVPAALVVHLTWPIVTDQHTFNIRVLLFIVMCVLLCVVHLCLHQRNGCEVLLWWSWLVMCACVCMCLIWRSGDCCWVVLMSQGFGFDCVCVCVFKVVLLMHTCICPTLMLCCVARPNSYTYLYCVVRRFQMWTRCVVDLSHPTSQFKDSCIMHDHSKFSHVTLQLCCRGSTCW